MVWVIVIMAVIFALVGVSSLVYRHRLGQQIALMAEIETSRAADVAQLAPGTVVEVKGTLRCVAPLAAEFSKVPCAYHKSEIHREVETSERTADGRLESKTRREQVHSNTKFAPCTVEDASGSVALNLADAEVEGESVLSRRESEAGGSVPRFNISIGGNQTNILGQDKSLHYTEIILAKDIPIYVLGEVQADRSLGKPAPGSKNRVFVVSQKSEEERSRDLVRTRLWLLLTAIGMFAVAAFVGWLATRM